MESPISLRSHHPEFFTELLEFFYRWDQYYRVKDISSFERGESSLVEGVAVADQLEKVNQKTI